MSINSGKSSLSKDSDSDHHEGSEGKTVSEMVQASDSTESVEPRARRKRGVIAPPPTGSDNVRTSELQYPKYEKDEQ